MVRRRGRRWQLKGTGTKDWTSSGGARNKEARTDESVAREKTKENRRTDEERDAANKEGKGRLTPQPSELEGKLGEQFNKLHSGTLQLCARLGKTITGSTKLTRGVVENLRAV